MFCLLATALCWLTMAPVRAGGLPQEIQDLDAPGYAPGKGILRQLAFDCRILRKLQMSVTDIVARRDSYSMLMRSVQGSGSAVGFASSFLGPSVDAAAGVEVARVEGAAGELTPPVSRAVTSIDAVPTGDVSPAGATFFSGGAMSRASTGKSCTCCSAHFAASPFKGLFVLYS